MLTIHDVKGSHASRPAIIAGSGPSLSKVDKRVYDSVVFAVNAAILQLERADYFVSGDPGCLCHEYWDVVARERQCKIMLSFLNKEMSTDEGMIDRTILWFRNLSKKGEWRIDGCARNVIAGPNSAICAVHLAAMMGCSPIYLVGCDCCRDPDGNIYTWEKSGDARGAPRPEHEENFRISRESGTHPEPNYFIHAWEKIVRFNPNLRIYDASGGGLTDSVIQVSYDDMVEGTYNERPPEWEAAKRADNFAKLARRSNYQRVAKRDQMRKARAAAKSKTSADVTVNRG